MASGVFLSSGKRSPFFVPMAEDGRFATYDTRIDPYLTPPPHPRLLTRGAASKPQRLRSTLSSKRSASVFMSNQPDREHEDGDRPSGPRRPLAFL